MSRIPRRPPPTNVGKVMTSVRPDSPRRYRVTYALGGELNDWVTVDVGLGVPRPGAEMSADAQKKLVRKRARAHLEAMLKSWPED